MTPEEKKALEVFNAAPDVDAAAAAFEAAHDAPAIAPAPMHAPAPGMFENGTQSDAALRGFGQGASFGFSDEAAGAVEGASSGWTNALSSAGQTGPGRALLRALGIGDNISDEQLDAVLRDAPDEVMGRLFGQTPGAVKKGYVRGRDEARGGNEAAKEAHPFTYGASEFAGGVMVPVPGAAAAKPLHLGGKYVLTRQGARVAAGAGTGALMGAGYGTADFADDSPEAQTKGGGFAGDVLPGMAVGGVAGPVFGALGDRFGMWLKQRSQENALKALGSRAGISSQLEKRGYETADEARGLGQAALDMDLIPFGSKAEGVLRETVEAKPRYGAMIKDALASPGDRPFDFQRAAWEAVGAVHGPSGLTEAAQDVARPAAKQVGQILRQEGSDASFAAANRLKSDMYDAINYANDPKLKTQLQRKAASGLRKSIEEQVGETAGPEMADQLTTANRRYGQLLDIEGLAREEANRQLERGGPGVMGMSLSAMAGAGGYTAGGPLGGLAGAAIPLAARYLGPRSHSVAARTQQKLAPAMSEAFQRTQRGVQGYMDDEDLPISAFLANN